jgi:Fe/S biogenesis protein NfuA
MHEREVALLQPAEADHDADSLVCMPVDVTDTIITVSDAALAKILELREAEDDPQSLGLRIEVTGVRGADFTYDLSFEPLDEADADDLIASQGDLRIVVPEASAADLRGAVLDLPSNEAQGGLVLRNPNRPHTPQLGDAIELTGTPDEKVRQLLDQQVNPAIAAHGGFASLIRVEGETAYISMGGGCQGCALSAVTLREGIEAAILGAIPEIKEVIDETDHAVGANPFYS